MWHSVTLSTMVRAVCLAWCGTHSQCWCGTTLSLPRTKSAVLLRIASAHVEPSLLVVINTDGEQERQCS